jgi:hypothetical protein
MDIGAIGDILWKTNERIARRESHMGQFPGPAGRSDPAGSGFCSTVYAKVRGFQQLQRTL